MVACGFREKEPQINADERRFVDLNLQPSLTVYSAIKSLQRMQSSEVSKTFALISVKAPKPQLRTQITRIGRISTDPCASAVFKLGDFSDRIDRIYGICF